MEGVFQVKSKYQNIGFLSREDYLNSLAKRYNLAKESVYEIANILGEQEDFDGLFGLLDDYKALANTETLYNLWDDITSYKDEGSNRTYYLTSSQLQKNYGKVKVYKENIPKGTYQYDKSVEKKYKDIIKRRNAGLSNVHFEYPKPILIF
jgi:hypothetical protein